MVVVFPSVWWGWSPPIINISLWDDPIGNLKMYILPAAILGMAINGVNMRLTRTMMLEVVREDYIRTAYSKGLNERIVVIRHALKNALIPVITVIGLNVPVVVGGSVIIEQIFGLPGMGRLAVEAAFIRDYPLIVGVTLVFSVFVLIIILLTDLSYALLDPRIRYR
jgi:peptide/nickel transport system permease protein